MKIVVSKDKKTVDILGLPYNEKGKVSNPAKGESVGKSLLLINTGGAVITDHEVGDEFLKLNVTGYIPNPAFRRAAEPVTA